MCIFKCCDPLNLCMNIADLLTSHVTEARQQVIYPMGLEPLLTAKFPTRWAQQWLGNGSIQSQQPPSNGWQRMILKWDQSLR